MWLLSAFLAVMNRACTLSNPQQGESILRTAGQDSDWGLLNPFWDPLVFTSYLDGVLQQVVGEPCCGKGRSFFFRKHFQFVNHLSSSSLRLVTFIPVTTFSFSWMLDPQWAFQMFASPDNLEERNFPNKFFRDELYLFCARICKLQTIFNEKHTLVFSDTKY